MFTVLLVCWFAIYVAVVWLFLSWWHLPCRWRYILHFMINVQSLGQTLVQQPLRQTLRLIHTNLYLRIVCFAMLRTTCLVIVTPHRLHSQNIGHTRFVYVCNERHIANTYLHCARHSSICSQCCFSGCEKLRGRTGFALLPWFLSMSDYHFWGNTTFDQATASSFAKLQRCGSCESGWHHWWVGYKACRKRGTKSCDVPKSNLEEAPIDGVGNSAYRLYNFLVALTHQWIVQQDPRLLL